MEKQVKDIIIKALENAGYEVEIDNGTLIVNDSTPIMEFL